MLPILHGLDNEPRVAVTSVEEFTTNHVTPTSHYLSELAYGQGGDRVPQTPYVWIWVYDEVTLS